MTKRKIKLLTIVGLIAGFIITLTSILKWYVNYVDLSQLFFGIGIGIFVLVSSYIYQRFIEISEELKELNKGLDLQNLWIHDELKKRPIVHIKLDEKKELV